MGFLDWLVARDRRLAETKYAGRESATARGARVRRERHRNSMAKSARQSERWERQDRRRFGN